MKIPQVGSCWMLNSLRKGDAYKVGGKAANLGELMSVEIPVPMGYVVLPKEDIADEVMHYYKTIGGGKVAVRSSATGEDGTDHSFAGQHDTFLNVEGRHDLINAITACWNSLGSDRAKAYRKERGIADDSVNMSVVVQNMVDPLYAGTMFTVDPVFEEPNEIVIEAVQGLGESLVSGSATPAQFVRSRQGELLRSRNESTAPLSDVIQLGLISFGMLIELHYGCPQDIEWAMDKDWKIWILQTRPITTLS